MPEHYDVIVIGSGAGGGTLTHALAPTGARVLLLERGGWMPREIQNWDPRAIWADQRYRNSGPWLDEGTGREFIPKQHYYVGGNTKVYGAVLSASVSATSARCVTSTASRRPGRSPATTSVRARGGPLQRVRA